MQMAKLSARGRKVLVAVTREYDQATLERASEHRGFGPSLTVWERCSRRLMSDGTVLEKRDVRFRPSLNPLPYDDPKGDRHSYGWKVHGKIKAGITPAAYQQIYLEPRKDGSPSLWTLETGVEAPKVISQTRILRAIESGESIGFCQGCGAEQLGCEPDARAYTCESCGKPEVYGAEELLSGL